MPTRDLTFAIVGSGGDGVITVGDMIAQTGAFEGLHVMKVEAYGPQIRGGESSCTVRVSADPIFAQGDFVQVLVVFNWADFAQFRGEIVAAEDAIVLYEASDETPREDIDLGPVEEVRWVPVPFIELAKESAGTTLAKNIVTLGLLGELFNLPKGPMEQAIKKRFSKKKEAVLEANLKGFQAGMDYAAKIAEEASGKRLSYTPGEPMLLMSGNELCAVAALEAGCRFFAGYPITPSSEVLHLLSELMPKVGGYLVQTEDELSAIGAVIGGSFAGSQEHDRHIGARPRADDRNARSRVDGRNPGGDHRRPAWWALHGLADEVRAVGSVAGALGLAWRRSESGSCAGRR